MTKRALTVFTCCPLRAAKQLIIGIFTEMSLDNISITRAGSDIVIITREPQ